MKAKVIRKTAVTFLKVTLKYLRSRSQSRDLRHLGLGGTVGFFSDLFTTFPIFFPFVYPFGNKERTLVLCCVDGGDVSGNTFLV